MPPRLLIVTSACHGVEGYLRQRRAGGRAARRASGASTRARPGRGRAVHPCAQPVRLLAHPPHHARERGPEPQLPRFQRSRCRSTQAYRELQPLLLPERMAARRRTTTRRSAAWIDAARRGGLPGRRSRGGQHEFPDGLFFGGTRADLEQPDLARGAAHARPARRRASPGSTSTPASGPSGIGERIFAGRDDAAAVRARPRAGGAAAADAGHLDLRRLVDLGLPHRA